MMISFIIFFSCFCFGFSNKVAGICDQFSANNWTLSSFNETKNFGNNTFLSKNYSASMGQCFTQCCSIKSNFLYNKINFNFA